MSGCVVGGCLSFDGADDYVRILDAPELRLTGDISVSAWIRPSSLGATLSVVSKRYEFELGWIDSASPYPLKWSHKSSGGTLISGNLTASTTAGQWQHVTLVRAGGIVRGYRDGALVSSSSIPTPPGSNSYHVNIGRNPGGNQEFRGLIDEVRIYDRALSDAEVAELVGGVVEPPPPDTQAPSQPTNLRATAVSSSRIDLSWTASTDDRGVVGYRVYRGAEQVATVPGTEYSDTGLAAGTTYAYTVAAVDAAGNLSLKSDAASATTSAAEPQREDITLVGAGLSNPTAMAVAPDGRIFVAEQGGRLRVVKVSMLLAEPFLSVSVVATNERGLLGVEFDPAFASNGHVYVYYTANTSPIVNRLSRFTVSAANPDQADPTSEKILLDGIPSQTGWHNGGAIHFGPDGKLYVAVGEGHHGHNAQSLATVSGKLLRVNPDGSIPSDNPFFATATGTNRAIWALGVRNPFTFDVQAATGRIFVNDVGENGWEEIDEARSGPNDGTNASFNFGWPTTEGLTSDPRFHTPFHAYPQAGGDCAITGGAFYDPDVVNVPVEYVGDYFFADYCAGWVKTVDLTTKAVTTFLAADGTRDPVDLKVAPDGSLYYLACAVNGTPSLHRVRYLNANEAPSIVTQPSDRQVAVGGNATFSVTAAGTMPLTYRWQRNGVDLLDATRSSYTLANAQLSDSGSRFRVISGTASGALRAWRRR